MFLELNGYRLDLPDAPIWGDRVIAVVLGQITDEEFTAAIDPFVVPLQD